MNERASSYLPSLHQVPGYFSSLDAGIFVALCETQTANGLHGDLLEIGAFWGRSAILLGYLVESGEQLHVNDLFDRPPPTESGREELAQSKDVMPTRSQFEQTFLRFHEGLPVVHQCSSAALADVLPPRSFRFIHIDGSHTQEAVESDIALSTGLLKDGAFAVLDDYAHPMHPGVAAALWPALAEGRLIPFAGTPSKLYAATNADAAESGLHDIASLVSRQGLVSRQSVVFGHRFLAIKPPPPSVLGRYVRATRRALLQIPR